MRAGKGEVGEVGEEAEHGTNLLMHLLCGLKGPWLLLETLRRAGCVEGLAARASREHGLSITCAPCKADAMWGFSGVAACHADETGSRLDIQG